MSIKVSQLFYYPVKSLKGVKTSQISIDDFGPEWDRRLMVVDENGRFITQRQCPKMGQISASISNERLFLVNDSDSISFELSNLKVLTQTDTVNVWADKVSAKILPDSVNQWLSQQIGRRARLCFIDDATHRQVDIEFAQEGDRTGFSDGFPFLILSEASVDFLSEKLEFDLGVLRFRPNIVVSGCDAFEEDNWSTIEINGIQFDLVKPCSRCVIPTLSLNDAEKQPQVMQVMLKYRKQGKQVYVGQNAIHRGLGVIKVGHEIKIII